MKKLSRELLINTVRTNRKALKLTQAQLAQKTGIHRAMIGRIETGEYLPNVEQLETLGETLHFEVVDLYIEEKKPEGTPTKEAVLNKKYNIAVAGTGYGISVE